jgi:hypothetical protein
MMMNEPDTLSRTLQMLADQALAIADLRKQVYTLVADVGGLKEHADIMREIKADITAIESRQSALIASITGLASQAIASSRPGNLVQIGGFVLAVTLLLLNLIGYSVGFHNGRVSLEHIESLPPSSNANKR